MRSTEVDCERTAIIASTSGPFGPEAGLRPPLLTRLP